jgi:hypothetical protein
MTTGEYNRTSMYSHPTRVTFMMLALAATARGQSVDGAAPPADNPALANLARSLQSGSQEQRLLAIVNVASEGARAMSLSPRLVKIADEGTPVEQVCSVWALGWIGAGEAVPALTRALASREWRVVLAATDVLAGFGVDAKPTLAALRELENGHWMAAVRERAAAARKAIDRSAPDEHARSHERGTLGRKHALEEFVSGAFRELSGDPCQLASGTPFERDGQTFEVGRGAGNAEATRTLAALLPDKLASRREYAGLRAVTPVDDGWLVGTDRGGPEGDLRFVSKRGQSSVLWRAPIQSLVKVGAHLLATSDQRDLPGLSTRNVLLVSRTSAAKRPWVVRRLAFLPGRDHVAIPVASDAALYVTQYGAVTVRIDGSMRDSACPEHVSDAPAMGPLDHVGRAKASRRAPAIEASGIQGRLADTLAVIDAILNHPRVLPHFHLADSPEAVARIERLPVDLGASSTTVKAGGRPVRWVEAPAAQDFRFLDLVFETADSATVAFEHRAEGVEGYAILARRSGQWQVAGLTMIGE